RRNRCTGATIGIIAMGVGTTAIGIIVTGVGTAITGTITTGAGIIGDAQSVAAG
ncbi:MAG: hypothetical protein V7634_547, partial [Bradyrhizobium sp.]